MKQNVVKEPKQKSCIEFTKLKCATFHIQATDLKKRNSSNSFTCLSILAVFSQKTVAVAAEARVAVAGPAVAGPIVARPTVAGPAVTGPVVAGPAIAA